MAVKLVGGALEIDVFDVLSSWLAFKNPIPEGWKGETSLVYALTQYFYRLLTLGFSQKSNGL